MTTGGGDYGWSATTLGTAPPVGTAGGTYARQATATGPAQRAYGHTLADLDERMKLAGENRAFRRALKKSAPLMRCWKMVASNENSCEGWMRYPISPACVPRQRANKAAGVSRAARYGLPTRITHST